MIEQPRARRYPFAATMELVDMDSETETREQTKDLSVFGCNVNAAKPWAAGTKVRLRVVHRGAVFAALGQVVNAGRNGMGIAFTQIEQKDQLVLEKWVAEARDALERSSSNR